MKYFIYGILISFALVFYAKGLTSSIYLQPSLYFGVIILLISFSNIFFKFKLDSRLFYLFILSMIVLLSLILQTFFIVHENGFLNEFGRVVFPYLTTISTFYILKKLNNKIAWRTFINMIILLLVLDTMLRLFLVGKFIISFENRYETKGPGLMFIDPNFTGYIAAVIFLQLEKLKIVLKNLYKYKIVLAIIVIYSMSFSVYVSLFLVYFIKYTSKIPFIKSILVIIVPIIMFFLYGYISNDGSFLTKLEIIHLSYLYIISHSFFEIIIGIGHGNFATFFIETNHGAHNFIGMSVEGGLLFVLINILIYHFFSKNKENSLAIIFILVAGIASMYPMAYMSVIYVLFLFDNKRDLLVNKLYEGKS